MTPPFPPEQWENTTAVRSRAVAPECGAAGEEIRERRRSQCRSPAPLDSWLHFSTLYQEERTGRVYILDIDTSVRVKHSVLQRLLDLTRFDVIRRFRVGSFHLQQRVDIKLDAYHIKSYHYSLAVRHGRWSAFHKLFPKIYGLFPWLKQVYLLFSLRSKGVVKCNVFVALRCSCILGNFWFALFSVKFKFRCQYLRNGCKIQRE